MTIDQAEDNIGQKVVYTAYAGAQREIGVITKIQGAWAIVDYGHGSVVQTKATNPSQLTLLSQTENDKDTQDD